MKTIPAVQFRHLKEFRFWLIGIAAGIAAIHLTLTWRADNVDLFGSSLLFFLAVVSLLRDRQTPLKLDSGISASGIGIVLITFVLVRSVVMPSKVFLLLSPLLAALGLALLASGFNGLRQYYRELTVLFFLGAPQALVPPLVDTTGITAKFATLVLWYLGFKVSRDGLNIYLNSGAVEVYPGCSGIEGITYLLSLAGLFLVMFPMNWFKRGLTLLVAVTVAFVVNGMRVALMAHLVASSEMEVFQYWHKGDGSLIFSMISVLLFGACCWGLNQHEQVAEQDVDDVDDLADSDTLELQEP